MTQAVSATQPSGAVESKGLKGGALGLLGSIVVGIASTAPAYSLAASLGFVVATANGDGIVGVKAPAIMLIAFIPMYFIAVAYQELNKAEPDCGTTFTWAARAFGPHAGWMGGWGILAADVIVMANLSQIAGSYSFNLVGADGLAASQFWSTVAGVIWILIMTYICYRGIEVSARLQYGMLGIEVLVLIAFSIYALAKVYAGNAPAGSLHPSLTWLWPSGLSTSALVSATLIAVFIYWGWDSAVACNEETADPGKTPGRAAIISTVLLLLTYALVSIATVAFAGVGDKGIGLGNPDNSDDVFHAMGKSVFGGGLRRHAARRSVDHHRSDVGLLVYADDDPADGAHHPVDGRLQGNPIAVRSRSPSIPDADRLDHLDGWRLDRLLRRHDACQHEHPRRLDRGRRSHDRVLLRSDGLRLHLVLSQDPHQQLPRSGDARHHPDRRWNPVARRIQSRRASSTRSRTTATRPSSASAASSSSESAHCCSVSS